MSEATISGSNGETISKRKDPLVAIAEAVGLWVFLVVLMFAIFAKDQMMVAAYISVALAGMGVCMGFLRVWRGEGRS